MPKLPGARRAKTLSLDFPPAHPRGRTPGHFRGELRDPAGSQARGVVPDNWHGSYAGAMGCREFMPAGCSTRSTSRRRPYRLRRGSAADAIGSVANYLRQHGWQRRAHPLPRQSAWRQASRPGRPAGARHQAQLRQPASRRWARLNDQLAACGPLALVELQATATAAGRRQSTMSPGLELCRHALQLEQLLCAGGDRAGPGGARRRCRAGAPRPQHRQGAATRTLAPRSGRRPATGSRG